ncbi:MAG: DedA family protein [Candidatus ainarchaeum sp.]|nr:DedA family protein [Candidatus ainarchaeum sp.]
MDPFSFFAEFLLHLDQYIGLLIQAFGFWTYLVLFFVVFCETGLVFAPFLPGDSLLFISGSMAAKGFLDAWLLFIIFTVAAILGDTANYWIGNFFGKKIFREKFLFLKKEHFDAAQRFYARHGGKTIILARFMPVIRTFAPFVAGIAKMNYANFLGYNVIGAVVWVAIFVFGGYLFGNIPVVSENLSLIIIAIIIVSILPALFGFLRHYLKKKL